MNSYCRIVRWMVTLTMLAPAVSTAQISGSNDFRINEESYATESGEQQYPSVASSVGGFSVAWQDDNSSMSSDVMLRQYDEQGNATGTCMRINDDTTSLMFMPRPRVARQFPVGAIGEAFGNSVVVWQDTRIDLAGDIYAQVIRDDGQMMDANFRVNDDAPTGAQSNPAIAMWHSPNAMVSSFAVVWTDRRDGNDDIYCRWFNRRGDGGAVASGPAIRVNDDYGGWQYDQGEPRIAMSSLGNVIVVWRDFRGGVSKCFGQLFNRDQTRRGVNFRLDSLSMPTVTPSVMMADDASFAAVFVAGTGVDRDIVFQRYASNGRFIGDTARINSDTTGANYFPEIALQIGSDAFGQGYAIAWEQQDSLGVEGVVHYRTVDGRGQLASADKNVPGGNGKGESSVALASVGYGNVNPPPDRTLLVFEQNSETDSDIRAQVLEQYSPVGSRVVVSACSGGGDQMRPAVAANRDGATVVVWEDMRDDMRHIHARRYNRQVPNGGDFAIDGASTMSQFDPDVAMIPDGGFVVTWTEFTVELQTVRVRRFDADGRPLGDAFDLVAAGSGGNSSEPAIVGSSDGSFTIVSQDTRDDASGDIRMQRFAPDGSRYGASIRVNDDGADRPQSTPAIACREDGALLVVWRDDRTVDPSIMVQAFDSAGARFDANVRVDDDSDTTVQALPAVSFTSDGRALVAWLDLRNDQARGDIYARLCAELSPIAGDFRVNDVLGSASRYWPELPHPPSVAATTRDNVSDAGAFVVAWTDYRSADADIYVQKVDGSRSQLLSNLKMSNAEAGSTQNYVDVASANRNGETFGAWSDDRVQQSEGWSIWGRVVAYGPPVAGVPGGVASDSDHIVVYPGARCEVKLQLAGDGPAMLRLFSIDGSLVATLFNEHASAGSYRRMLPIIPTGAFVLELTTPRGVRTQMLASRR